MCSATFPSLRVRPGIAALFRSRRDTAYQQKNSKFRTLPVEGLRVPGPQARAALKKELMDHLRSKRRMRRSRHATASGQSRGQIVDAISIWERPPEVEDRAVSGHWQGDLLVGAKNTFMATLVERHSRFAMLIEVPSRNTAAVVAALSWQVRKLPAILRRSLTWDRGLEMAQRKAFTVATGVKVYFCDPQSPWSEARTKTPTSF
jgi:IS30 family transposase